MLTAIMENVWPNSTNTVPGSEGVGDCKALKGYAKWFVEESLPDCRFGSSQKRQMRSY